MVGNPGNPQPWLLYDDDRKALPSGPKKSFYLLTRKFSTAGTRSPAPKCLNNRKLPQSQNNKAGSRAILPSAQCHFLRTGALPISLFTSSVLHQNLISDHLTFIGFRKKKSFGASNRTHRYFPRPWKIRVNGKVTVRI